MTKTLAPRPWHEVVRLEEELRTGELSLAQFTAESAAEERFLASIPFRIGDALAPCGGRC